MSVDQRIRIRCFTTVGICASMPEDAIPTDKILDDFVIVVSLLDKVDPAAREDLKNLVEITSDALLRCTLIGAPSRVDQFIDIYNQLVYAPKGRIRREGVVRPIVIEAKNLRTYIRKAKDLSSDFEMCQFADELLQTLNRVIENLMRYV